MTITELRELLPTVSDDYSGSRLTIEEEWVDKEGSVKILRAHGVHMNTIVVEFIFENDTLTRIDAYWY